MTGIFDHPWLGGLFGDEEMGALWAPEAQMAHMLAFEAAWSHALGQAGLQPFETAQKAARHVETFRPDMKALREATAQDGLPIPELVRQLKAGFEAKEAIHAGATSQDVIDTALSRTLRGTTDLLLTGIGDLQAGLDRLDREHGDAALMARTRMQAARPITVHDRLRNWRLPLDDHRARLSALRERTERVAIGGATGDGAALGEAADAVHASLAERLGLARPASSWHARRDGIADYANALSLVSGTLGKMGQDVCLMAQQGIDEIALTGGGSSSAMAHKNNPVGAELLVTLARFNAVQLSAMHQSLIHEQERSGAAWMLEWMVLPQMAMASARSLALGCRICEQVMRIGTPPSAG